MPISRKGRRRMRRLRKVQNPNMFGIAQAAQRARMAQRIENAKSIPIRNANGQIVAGGAAGKVGPMARMRKRRRFDVGRPPNRKFVQRGLAAKQAYGIVPVSLTDDDT